MKKMLLAISLALTLFGMDIKKAYLQSYNYEKMGDYKDAIKVLIPLYDKYPNGYTLNLRLGWLFYLNKNYKNAIEHYKKAMSILPYSFEPKLGLMRVYNAMGKYSKTIEIGNVLLKSDYYNFYGNYYYALALMGQKNYKEALSLCNKMITVYPTSIMYLNLLAENYWYLGKKDYAKEIFENILILDPNNPTAKEFMSK
jgi:tetratricopeptide (TPR) repeat protein